MTTFVDFAVASGTRQLTCVRNAKEMYSDGYEPKIDFWKPLREAIVSLLRENRPKDSLREFMSGITHEQKLTSYPKVLAGFEKWMGRKRIEWFGYEPVTWRSGDLSVRVNPELGVRMDGVDHVIKLYFKAEQPTKPRLDTMLHMINTTIPSKYAVSKVGILDIQRSKLHVPTRPIANLDALLAGQAAAFVEMWKRI